MSVRRRLIAEYRKALRHYDHFTAKADAGARGAAERAKAAWMAARVLRTRLDGLGWEDRDEKAKP